MTAIGSFISQDDPDIAFIKAITGSRDLSEFADINAHAHLLDVRNGNWHMLHAVLDANTFKDYCAYLWEEAYKVVSKQKKNMLAVKNSFPSVLASYIGKELFEKRLPLYMNMPRDKMQNNQVKQFKNDQNEYSNALLEFKAMLREKSASAEDVNIDVLVTEGNIFAEAWFELANTLEKNRALRNLSDAQATGEITSYHLAISYIYHILHSMLESLSDVIKPNDLYVMIKIYWLTVLAKNEQASRKEGQDNKIEYKTSTLSLDDYIIKMLLPDNIRGVTVKSEKVFWRDVVTKAWFYNESLKENNRKQNLEIEISHTLKSYYGMEEETVRKYVRSILKSGWLVNGLPDELKKAFRRVE